MTAFKIEDGVPVPKKKGPGPPYKYKFAEMTVGQSARVKASYATMKTCTRKFCAKPENAGWEFQIEPINEKTTRIHRIK